jgi:hypothetical protein
MYGRPPAEMLGQSLADELGNARRLLQEASTQPSAEKAEILANHLGILRNMARHYAIALAVAESEEDANHAS